MTVLESALLAAAVALYLATYILTGKGQARIGLFGLLAGLAFQLVSIIVRWVGSGHPPVFGTYEATLSASWFLLLFVALSWRSARAVFRLLVLTSIPLALLLLVYGLAFFGTDRMPLTISERSLWVDIHALFSWLAYAPFTLAFCLSGFYLWANRGRSGAEGGTVSSENEKHELEIIDELVFRYINFGFVSHTLMFATGSYYASMLFGTAWGRWDPVFSLSLLAWLLIGLYIHMRLLYHWKAMRACWLFIVVFSVINLSYWVMTYLPMGSTFHVFDLDPKAL